MRERARAQLAFVRQKNAFRGRATAPLFLIFLISLPRSRDIVAKDRWRCQKIAGENGTIVFLWLVRAHRTRVTEVRFDFDFEISIQGVFVSHTVGRNDRLVLCVSLFLPFLLSTLEIIRFAGIGNVTRTRKEISLSHAYL